MNSFYDWAAIGLFALLIVLFLKRSTGPVEQGDNVLLYLPPSIGCAAGNYLGNHGAWLPAILTLSATLAYFMLVLKPLSDGE